MKNKNVVMTVGGPEDFFKRASGHATKLDRGENLPSEIRVMFVDPADLVRALSVERLRVLQVIRQKQGKSLTTLSSLAVKLKRDRKAVVRDVTLLEKLGLLRIRTQANPGHGIVKVVEPLAKKYHV